MAKCVIIAILAGGLATVGVWASPLGQQRADKKLAHDLTVEQRICTRWMPILKKLQPDGGRTQLTRPGGSDFMEAVSGHQPRWVEVQAGTYRRLLEEWNYELRARVAGNTAATRERTRREVDRLIASGAIKIWQARARFLRVPGEYTVTQIGIAERGAQRHDFTQADFAKEGYRYIFSRAEPQVSDLDPEINRVTGYFFLDGGLGNIFSGAENNILSLGYRVRPGQSRSGVVKLIKSC